VDQTLPLQLLRCSGHALPTHAQHACDAFLRDSHFVADLPIQVLQQPTTQLWRQ